MDLGITAAIGAKVADTLVGYAVGKFLDHAAGRPVANYFEDRTTKLEFRRAVTFAIEQIVAIHPGHRDFFDESFVEHRLAPELASLLTRTGRPDPIVIAEQYSGYFHTEIKNAEAIATDFVTFLERAMGEQPKLSAMLDSRQIDATYEIVKGLQDSFRLQNSAPSFHTGYKSLPPPMSKPEQDAVVELLGRASRTLLSWPQTLVTGTWIEREELNTLAEAAQSEESSITILLGRPGSGKSALLAHLVERLEGSTLLALKADRIPREITSVTQLSRWLELNEPLDVVLTRLADSKPVVVLLDQLDALCELIDQHTQRLAVLIELVHAISKHPAIHIVMTCREFEFSHDIRLRSLNAVEVPLALPQWDDVSEVLGSHGFQPEGWPQSLRDMLCTPQQLNVFLRFITNESAGNFDTYQQMLEEVWRRFVLPPNAPAGCVLLIEEVATHIAQQEELWVPVAAYDARRSDLDHMIAAGVLRLTENERLVGFSHQTLFDFARARVFAAEKVRLSDHVLERQNGLFVRPTLWSTLTYLRGADAGTYREEFERLWQTENLRVHIRTLLAEFLTQQAAPTDWEATLMFLELEKDVPRFRVLFGMAGSPGWFRRLATGPHPTLMKREKNVAFAARRLLGSALRFDTETVLTLIEKHWLPDSSWDEFAVIVLDDLPAWDERAIQIAETCFLRSDIAEHWKSGLTSSLSVDMPDEAPRLIRASFDKSLEVARSQEVEISPSPADDAEDVEKMTFAWQEEAAKHDRYRKLIEDTTGWYDLVEIAKAAPVAFIEKLLPWLLEVLNAAAMDEHPFVVGYREDHSLVTSDDEEREGMRPAYPVWAAFQHAIDGYADLEPDRFMELVQTHQSSDVLAVHRLLMRGMARITKRLPNEVLLYLLDDPRRMIVGDMGNKHSDTQRIVQALVPHLPEDGALQLENAILTWSAYARMMEGWTAKERWDRLRWDRQHRLRLLNSFPDDHLSVAASRFRKEENRSLFPLREWDVKISGMTEISSPMSTDQMIRAKDYDILKLFDLLHDDTEFDHPCDYHRGGSVQASRALAEFAKQEPERALEIIVQMQPGKHERPVGYVVEALAQAEIISVPVLVGLVIKLHDKGFTSEGFQSHAANALRAIATEPDGLPDNVCELLESWLQDWTPPECEPLDKKATEDDASEGFHQPILWGGPSLRIVPRGNYPTLQALTMGYLLRRPSEFDTWLSILERHVARREDPDVWSFLGEELRWLRDADRPRAEEFIDRLFESQPEMYFSVDGAVTLAWVQQWASPDRVRRWLSAFLTSGWIKGPQAFGELLTLRRFWFPQEEWVDETIVKALSDDEWSGSTHTAIKIGIASVACNMYNDHASREKAAQLLLGLMDGAEGALALAITDVFRITDDGDVDANLLKLLASITSSPNTLSDGSKSFLIARLSDAISVAPETVCRCCELLVELIANETPDSDVGVSTHTSELVDIAITLQRYPDFRFRATNLFERLQELQAYGVEEALHDLDRHPRTNPPVQRRRRRRAH